MKKIITLQLFLCFFWSLHGQIADSLASKISAYLQPYLEMDAWSGTISIYKKGVPVFQKSYGFANREWEIPNTRNTKFRIASISKLFTEVAILQLVEAERLSLDDRLADFISDYPRGSEISIRHLLNHRSGIPHLNSFPNYNELIKFDYSLDEIIQLFKNKPLDFEPDERYRYSNSGYVLLAFIIEQLSGKTYENYVKEALLAPNGLELTGVDDEKKIIANRAKGYMFNNFGNLINAEYVNMDIKIGGGSLYSTANDLNIFVQNLLDGKILKKNLRDLPNFGELDGAEVFTANGRVQGFCHQITHRIEEELSIIVLGNHYSNIALPLSVDLYKIYKKEAYAIPENYFKQKVTLAANSLKQYEGTYDFGFGPIGKVKVIDGQLGYQAPGRKDYDLLIPIGNDQFFYIQSWVLLGFKDRKAETMDTLEWIMGGNVYPAKRVESN